MYHKNQMEKEKVLLSTSARNFLSLWISETLNMEIMNVAHWLVHPLYIEWSYFHLLFKNTLILLQKEEYQNESFY